VVDQGREERLRWVSVGDDAELTVGNLLLDHRPAEHGGEPLSARAPGRNHPQIFTELGPKEKTVVFSSSKWSSLTTRIRRPRSEFQSRNFQRKGGDAPRG